MPDAFEKMDRMYRYQRYIYDLTRKYYLLGRDRLLNELDAKPGETVLEVGCGTGRNLAILAKRCPEANFYGLDASSKMLETARMKLDKAGIANVRLEKSLAEEFDFGQSFDKIFFSYSISMISTWRESIDNALRNLKPDGTLYMVDFFDQAGQPEAFQHFLKWWLAHFEVHYRPELIPYLKELEVSGRGKLGLTSLYRRYSFIAEFRKLANAPETAEN
jgi:S-adenosylmethionine-diacylgycerolhomoserine-N-methlytransferase